MKFVVFGVVCLLIVVAMFLLKTRKARWPVSNICSVCGAKSQHDSQYGYSQHSEEDPEKMKPLCRKCLIAQLEQDYTNYLGRAVVIQPAVGPPCFVFQEINEWNTAFKDSKIGKDAQSLLAEIETQCRDCKQKANFLWVESSGLNGDNFEETLDKGMSKTLLLKNPKPISVCGKCCVARIANALEKEDIEYIEVCGPKGNTDGFVVPMGY
jgi:hypothetical protein